MFTANTPTTGPSAHHEAFRHGEVLVPSLPGFKTRAQPKTGRVKGRAGELRRKFIAITGTTLFAATLMNFSSFTTATANAAQVTCTADVGYTNCVRFTYSGADQTFTVPAGAINLNVRAWGANGGLYPGGTGGGGGFASGTLSVTPGSTLTIVAGQAGAFGRGAFGGGGGGSIYALGGGGMSAVFDGASARAGVQVVAGGGGGNDYQSSGGVGGGLPVATARHPDSGQAALKVRVGMVES